MISTDSISLSTKGFTDVIDITEKVENIIHNSGYSEWFVDSFLFRLYREYYHN